MNLHVYNPHKSVAFPHQIPTSTNKLYPTFAMFRHLIATSQKTPQSLLLSPEPPTSRAVPL